MTAGTQFTFGALRRRRWRGAVVATWLMLALVNLVGIVAVPAVGGLPSDVEIRSSICHSGIAADDPSAPTVPESRHCPLCLVVAMGGMAPPPDRLVLVFRPRQSAPAVAAIGVGRPFSVPIFGPSAPRAPPIRA